MNIRRLGSKGRFYEFEEEDCPWCDAARHYFERNPELPEGETVHFENERGEIRTLTLAQHDPIVVECEPYVFYHWLSRR